MQCSHMSIKTAADMSIFTLYLYFLPRVVSATTVNPQVVIGAMRSAGLTLLGILFIRCQLSIRNSCFSECVTASLLRYSNESVCSENCFVCVTDIAPRLCLAWTKWILLYNFYACSNIYILFFFILLLCTCVRRSY